MTEMRETVIQEKYSEEFGKYLHSRGWQYTIDKERWYWNKACLVYRYVCDTWQYGEVLNFLRKFD
jgi:hypothetical protein